MTKIAGKERFRGKGKLAPMSPSACECQKPRQAGTADGRRENSVGKGERYGLSGEKYWGMGKTVGEVGRVDG